MGREVKAESEVFPVVGVPQSIFSKIETFCIEHINGTQMPTLEHY